jgi:hypothetical protein
VHELVSTRAFLGTAERFAASRRLRSRHALACVLEEAGLPQWQRLTKWLKILYWVLDCENGKTSLSQAALHDGRNTSTYYRSVERLTMYSWPEVQARGSAWILSMLIEELSTSEQALLRRNRRQYGARTS